MGLPQKSAFEAPYPVINAQPTALAVMRNFYVSDYFRLIWGTALGCAAGFAGGAQPVQRARDARLLPERSCSVPAGKPIRRQGFFWMGGIVFTCCFVGSFQQSYFRLTGMRPNEDECERAGVAFPSTN